MHHKTEIVMVTLIGFIKGKEEYQIEEYSKVFCKDDTEAKEIGLYNCFMKKWCSYQIKH